MALQNQFGLGSQIYPTNSMLNLQTNNTLVNEQRIIKVDGIDGAYKCALPYNTREILITDLYKPIVYLVTTDGINRMVNAFNITPVETQQNQNINQVADVKQDQNNDQVAEALTAINTRLTEMENKINELESNNANVKSNNASTNGKRNDSKRNGNASNV